MADDFDDDKDNKGNKKDHPGFAQFENAINEVKSQMRSTNQAELVRLNACISSLLSSDLPPEMLAKLKDLQAVVNERAEQAEQIILSQQLDEAREAEAARLASFLEMEAQEAARVEQFHQESLKFEEKCEDAEKYLAARREESSRFSDVVKDFEKDGDVEPNKLLALIKTEDQIKKENEEYKKLHKHRDEAHKSYKEVSTHHQGLLTERERLGNELTKKEKIEKPQSPAIVNTKERIKHQDKKIKAFEPVLAKAKAQKDRMDAAVKEVDEVFEQCDIGVKKIIKEANESKDLTSEKRKMLNQFATLFSNQQEAIIGDGIVQDTVVRGEFIEQLKNEKDIEPELENSKTQKESTNTNKEQDKSQTADSNNLSADTIANKGDKVIEHLGYSEHLVIMKQLHGIKSEHPTTKELANLTTGPLKPVVTPINHGDPNKNKGRGK